VLGEAGGNHLFGCDGRHRRVVVLDVNNNAVEESDGGRRWRRKEKDGDLQWIDFEEDNVCDRRSGSDARLLHNFVSLAHPHCKSHKFFDLPKYLVETGFYMSEKSVLCGISAVSGQESYTD
jgi:hypothetical protein